MLTRMMESLSMDRQHTLTDTVTETAGITTTQPEMIIADQDQPGVYKCTECNAQYKKHGVLVNHLAKKHNIINTPLLSCDVCEKKFDAVKKLNRHKKSCLPL